MLFSSMNRLVMLFHPKNVIMEKVSPVRVDCDT
jgi:hypothetical protein